MKAVSTGAMVVVLLLLHSASAHADSHAHSKAHREGHDHATSQHRFNEIEKWRAAFEDPARDAWQLPDRVVSVLVDSPDLVIADVGSATGYFAVRFARAVPQGTVIGADIEPGMVIELNDRARREGLENLVSVLAGPDGPHLPRTVDLLFFCDTVHHINSRVAYFTQLKPSLRPGGRVAIVDFRPDSKRGPSHKLDPAQVIDEMRQAGYALAGRHEFLPDQYFLIFEISAPANTAP